MRAAVRKPSPISAALHDAFRGHLFPLLERLGFGLSKPERVRPGLVVTMATLVLGERRRVEATLWCDGATGNGLRFRLDVVEPIDGVECRGQVELQVPWPDRAYPKALSLDFSGGEFRPQEGHDRLDTAVAFLAGAFAANTLRISEAIPELATALREASTEPGWQQAARQGATLWKTRHLRGPLEERPVAATVVFLGPNLLTVEADGIRLTFRLPTNKLDQALALSVSGWYGAPAGTRIATTLMNGPNVWRFDHRGELDVD
jgi:hypothetical protein